MTISDLPVDVYWETFSGLESTAQSTEYSDGVSYALKKIVGARQIADVTLMKPFVPDEDWQLFTWYKTWCTTGVGVLITLQPVKYCPEAEPLGQALVLEDCKPVRLNGFELDKKSQDVTNIELTFSVDNAVLR